MAFRVVQRSYALAYAHRLYTSRQVNTYARVPSFFIKWIVSTSTRAPGCLGSGRGTGAWKRFQGLRFRRRLCRSRMRFTEDRDISMPCSSLSRRCTTSADRWCSRRISMIFWTTSSLSVRGCAGGRELFAGIGTSPKRFASFRHFVTVPGDTPYRLAAQRTPYFLANRAQSLRTRSCFLSFVYIHFILDEVFPSY